MKKIILIVATLCMSCASINASVRCCMYCHGQGVGVYKVYDIPSSTNVSETAYYECVCDGPNKGELVIDND